MPLTLEDRTQIAKELKAHISHSYCLKVLNERGEPPKTLDPKTFDAFARYVGYKSWNDFLIKNKLSYEQYHRLMQPENRTELERYLTNRMTELLTVQLMIEFGE